VFRERLLEERIFAGIDLGPDYTGYENTLLMAVTEVRNWEELDRTITAFRNVLS